MPIRVRFRKNQFLCLFWLNSLYHKLINNIQSILMRSVLNCNIQLFIFPSFFRFCCKWLHFFSFKSEFLYWRKIIFLWALDILSKTKISYIPFPFLWITVWNITGLSKFFIFWRFANFWETRWSWFIFLFLMKTSIILSCFFLVILS